MNHEYKENSEYLICINCGLAEGELTTECPEFNISGVLSDLIYGGYINYFQGEWQVRRDSIDLHVLLNYLGV